MELQFRPDPADRKLSANPYDTQQWYMSYSLRSAGSGWNCSSVLILLIASCQQTRMTHSNGICHIGLLTACDQQDQDGPLHVLLHHNSAFVLHNFFLVFLY